MNIQYLSTELSGNQPEGVPVRENCCGKVILNFKLHNGNTKRLSVNYTKSKGKNSFNEKNILLERF